MCGSTLGPVSRLSFRRYENAVRPRSGKRQSATVKISAPLRTPRSRGGKIPYCVSTGRIKLDGDHPPARPELFPRSARAIGSSLASESPGRRRRARLTAKKEGRKRGDKLGVVPQQPPSRVAPAEAISMTFRQNNRDCP
jgi:hypothetical protein